LSIEQLATRYRESKDVVERSHYQMIWLLAQGQSTAEVARVTGYSVYWVRVLARRYNAQGGSGLSDLRHAHPGRECMLSAAQQAELEQALQAPPADGGLWSGPKVARWMATLLGRSVAAQIISLLEGVAKGWNLDPTPFEWGGKRFARRQRGRQRRPTLGGSGAGTRRMIRQCPTLWQKWLHSCQTTH
jgi:hypothetical protein